MENEKVVTLDKTGVAPTGGMFSDLPDVLSVDEASAALGVCKKEIYRLLRDGDIIHLRIGRVIKIPKRFRVDYILEKCYNADGRRLSDIKGGSKP